MSNARVVYTSPSITPEQGRDARARVWAFVFRCYLAKKKGGPATAPDARKESNNGSSETIMRD